MGNSLRWAVVCAVVSVGLAACSGGGGKSNSLQINTSSTSTVALFTFDEGTGSTSADASSNHLVASINGGASWVPGKTGSALSFDNGTAEARTA